MIVRSLRAGHPVPIAISMVAREMRDPIGSEFGIVVDEITYGADLESALRSLYFRIGQDDLPLFVTAVAIQGSTGGNLGEILENLSGVIRQRFKMRRKIRALAAEGRASAIILSSLPIAMFLIIQIVAPDFYASVWNESVTKTALAVAGKLDGGRKLHHVSAGELQDLKGVIAANGMIDILGEVFGDRATMMLALLVFLATAILTFGIMLGVRARGAIRRRAAGIAEALRRGPDRSSLRAFEPESCSAAARLRRQALRSRREGQRRSARYCAAG